MGAVHGVAGGASVLQVLEHLGMRGEGQAVHGLAQRHALRRRGAVDPAPQGVVDRQRADAARQRLIGRDHLLGERGAPAGRGHGGREERGLVVAREEAEAHEEVVRLGALQWRPLQPECVHQRTASPGRIPAEDDARAVGIGAARRDTARGARAKVGLGRGDRTEVEQHKVAGRVDGRKASLGPRGSAVEGAGCLPGAVSSALDGGRATGKRDSGARQPRRLPIARHHLGTGHGRQRAAVALAARLGLGRLAAHVTLVDASACH